MSSTICIATVYIHSFRNRNGGDRTVGRPPRNICGRIRFRLACPNRSEVAGQFLRLARGRQPKSAYLLGTRGAFFGVPARMVRPVAGTAALSQPGRAGQVAQADGREPFKPPSNITCSRYFRSRQSSSFQIQSPLQMRHAERERTPDAGDDPIRLVSPIPWRYLP
jgi:hypothetical protein